MTPEDRPKSEADRLRERLLGQWEPPRSSYLTYRKEIEAMLADQERKLRREKIFTGLMWIYVALLTTIMMTASGMKMIHKVEGAWVAVNAVFWLLFGALFLFAHLINKSRFEVIKEIKGLELRMAALEERLEDRGDGAGVSA